MSFKLNLILFSLFERAKIRIISIAHQKIAFLWKNNSLVCSCLFVWECLILRSNFAVEFFDRKTSNQF